MWSADVQNARPGEDRAFQFSVVGGQLRWGRPLVGDHSHCSRGLTDYSFGAATDHFNAPIGRFSAWLFAPHCIASNVQASIRHRRHPQLIMPRRSLGSHNYDGMQARTDHDPARWRGTLCCTAGARVTLPAGDGLCGVVQRICELPRRTP